MVQFLLVRPGTTEYDQQGRVQGTLDIPLCEDGRQEVEKMVDELRGKQIAAVYTSPCQAASQTAEALAAAFEMKPKTIDKLQNVDQGLWQGMLVAEVKTKQPRVYRQLQEQPETVCPPQGETLVAATQRVETAFSKLIKKHKTDGLVAVVAPEPLASVIRHAFGGEDWGDLWQSAKGRPRWQLIDPPQAVEAK